MALQKKIGRGLRSLRHLSRHFDEADKTEILKSIPNLDPNTISNELVSNENEEKSGNTDVSNEVSQNVKEQIPSEVASGNSDPNNEENTEHSLQPIVQSNYDWDIFGSPMYMEDDFCVEAINSCQETVLFKICLNREPIVHNNKIRILNNNMLPKVQVMIINELIETEETYLRKMKYVIENYLQYFRDQNIDPDIEKIFGNIEEIYHETENIYSQMITCFSVEDIANVFLKNASVFECYTTYLRNQMKIQQCPITEHNNLIKQRQMELEDMNTCESYLANPTQRLGRYKLLLENLGKVIAGDTETSRSLEEAIILVDTKISEANTLMAIDSIQGCPIDLHNGGRFLIKDTFNIVGKYPSVIFLFEKYVIFCKDIEGNPNLYDYIDNIDMDTLTLASTNNSMRFQLKRFQKEKKQDNEDLCEFDIESPLMVIKTKWVDEISRLLWNQLQYYKEKQDTGLRQIVAIDQPSNSSNQTEEPEDYGDQDQPSNLSTEPDETEDHINLDQPNDIFDRENESSLLEDTTLNENIAPYDEPTSLGHTFFDKDKVARIQISRSDSIRSRDVYIEGQPQTIFTELLQSEEAYLQEMRYIIGEAVSFNNSSLFKMSQFTLMSYCTINLLQRCNSVPQINSSLIQISNKLLLKTLLNLEDTQIKRQLQMLQKKISFGKVSSPSFMKTLLDNVEDIFNATQTLHLNLLECDTVETLSKAFLDHAYIFDLYVEYMRNHAMSYRNANNKIEDMVKDKEIKKNKQYTIDSYILNPVLIRPVKYKAMLEKLHREQTKMGLSFQLLNDALKLIDEKITEANTLMAIDSIQDCPFDLRRMGNYLKKGPFKLKRKHSRMVFLFKEIILICTEDKVRPDTYLYVDSIEMAHLTVTHNRNTLSFELIDSNKSKSAKDKACSFILEAPTKSVKEKWLSEIQNLLWEFVNNPKSFIGS